MHTWRTSYAHNPNDDDADGQLVDGIWKLDEE